MRTAGHYIVRAVCDVAELDACFHLPFRWHYLMVVTCAAGGRPICAFAALTTILAHWTEKLVVIRTYNMPITLTTILGGRSGIAEEENLPYLSLPNT